MDILIKNGTIVRAEELQKSDILIKDGKIEALGDNIKPVNQNTKIIDAEHYYIFPGGVDPHVHLHLETSVGYSSDDFLSGSLAALAGGTTTIFDFVTPRKGQNLNDALTERLKHAENCLIPYTFHVSPIDWTENTEKEIDEIFACGINSFKVYMTYKETIGLDLEKTEKVMVAVAKNKGVLAVHCEDGDKIDELRKFYISQGNTSPEFHPLSRPAATEADSVKDIIELAEKTKCTVYLVHISSKESLVHIRAAREKGIKIYAETCPQYLLLDDLLYLGEFEQTAAFVISPPLRGLEDNVILWKALYDGSISTVGTDHCPFYLKQKAAGKNDFTKIPNGAGGIEYRLTLLYTYGVMQKRITINKMVELFSTAPARIFGIYPQKGEIAIGSDADLVVWNPNFVQDISIETQYQKTDLNIYDGLTAIGRAEFVISEGEIMIENNKPVNSNIKGKFIKRGVFNQSF